MEISRVVGTLSNVGQKHLKSPILPPHTFEALVRNTESLELRALIETIDEMLAEPSSFVERFKQLCQIRAAGTPESVPYCRAPNSPSNVLLSELARKLLPQEWIPVLLPIATPTKILRLMPGRLQSDRTVDSVKEALRRGDLVWVEEPIVNFTTPLEECVMTSDGIFPLTEINAAPFDTQVEIYKVLRTCPYNLFDQVYNHNSHWVELKNDIESLHYGITVLAALAKLIHTFEKGGSRMTGQEEAARLSAVVFLEFTEGYLSRLPKATCDAVLSLQCVHDNRSLTLAGILQTVKEGGCTEIASGELRSLLRQNAASHLLNSVSDRVTDLSTLRSKYRLKGTLPTKITATLNGIDSIARRFAQDNVHSLNLQDPNDARQYFASFPVSAYPLLWNTFRLQNPIIPPVVILIGIIGSLDVTRQQALLNVMASTIRCLRHKAIVLRLLMLFSYPELEAKLVQSLSPLESTFLRLTENQNTETLLMKSFAEGDLSVFTSIPREYAVLALTMINRKGIRTLNYIRSLPLFTTVLRSVPENLRAGLVIDSHADLQFKRVNFTELAEFFKLFTTEDHFQKVVTQFSNSPSLIVEFKPPETIRGFLTQFPGAVQQSLKILLLLKGTRVWYETSIPLLKCFVLQPYALFKQFVGSNQGVLLKVLQTSLKVLNNEHGKFLDQMLEDLEYSDQWTPELILPACNTAQRVWTLFNKMPADRKMAYLHHADHEGNTLLMRSLHDVDTVSALFDFAILEIHFRDDLLRPNRHGVTAFTQAMKSHKESFDLILCRLRELLALSPFVSRTTGQQIGFWRYLFEEPSLCVRLLEDAANCIELPSFCVVRDIEGTNFLKYILGKFDDDLLKKLIEQVKPDSSLQRLLEILQVFVTSAAQRDQRRLELLMLNWGNEGQDEQGDATDFMDVLLDDNKLSNAIKDELKVLHERWSRQKLRRMDDAEDDELEPGPMSFTRQ